MLSVNEINLLKAQNEQLKKQNQSLQQEVRQLKKEDDLLDACIELMQMGKDERYCITKSEKKVLELIYLTNAEIAKELYLSITTVKSHIHNLLVKFKAKTRCELLLKAIMKGEIQI